MTLLITGIIIGWLLCGLVGILIATAELRRDLGYTGWTEFADRFGLFLLLCGPVTLITATLRYVGLLPLEHGTK